MVMISNVSYSPARLVFNVNEANKNFKITSNISHTHISHLRSSCSEVTANSTDAVKRNTLHVMKKNIMSVNSRLRTFLLMSVN